jgi:hypothetical protein
MRLNTTILFLIVTINLFSQESFKIEKIVELDSIFGVDKIKSSAILSLGELFPKDQQNVISSEGIISRHIEMKFDADNLGFGSNLFNGHITFSIQIQIKDNKYKYTLTNAHHKSSALNCQPCDMGLITDSEIPPRNFGTTKSQAKMIWNKAQNDLMLIASKIENGINLKLSSLNW